MTMNPSKADISRVRKLAAKRKKVSPKHLDFIGAYDYGQDGGKIYYFNITDKNHPDYRSTIVEKQPK